MISRLNQTLFFLVCLLGVVTTLAYGTVHQPLIALFYIVVAALSIVFIADAARSGELRISRDNLQLPLILAGLYGVIQVIPFGSSGSVGTADIPRTISIEPFATSVTAVHIFALSTFFVVASATVDSAARLRKLTAVIIVFGFIYSFFAILQSVLSPDRIYGIYKPRAGQPFGSFVNKHDFAAIIEMTIAIPIGMLFSGAVRNDKKLLYIVAIVLMGAALLLSGSRGGLVAFFAEVIFIIILTSRGGGRRLLLLKAALTGVLIVGAVAGAVFVGGDTTLTRISETTFSEDVTSSRKQIWAVTIKVIEQHFPLGAGFGAFPQAYSMADPHGGFERVEQAHNDYLQIAADAGIVGVALGAFFLFLFFRSGFGAVKVENLLRRGAAVGAFAGCFAVLVHSVFDFVLHITAVAVMFITLLVVMISSRRTFKDDEGEEIDRKRLRKASVSSLERRSE